MKKRVILLVSCLLLTAAGGLFSQSSDEALGGMDQMEERFFTLKNEGHYEKAVRTLFDGLLELYRIRSTGSTELRAELDARGECYLELVYSLVQNTAQFAETLEILEKVPEDATHFHALSLYMQLLIHLHLGDLEKAAAAKTALGFMDAWLLLGPFDNEQGGGFDTEFAPEKGIDLSGEYEGKERAVTWREHPCETRTGYVDLDALYQPRNQCLAYALTFLVADREMDACLRLGSDESVKVFLNGRKVYGLDARRLHHFDQDAVGLHLSKGINALLIKVCDQTGAWGFSARLTAPSGAPLQGVAVTTRPENPVVPEGEESPPEPEVSTGGLGYFTKQAEKDHGRAHLYLALLHQLREYKGEDRGLATRHVEAFLEKQPDHAYGHYLKALTEARRFDIQAERDDNRFRAGLEKSLALHERNVEARTRLGRYYMSSLSVPNLALRYAKEALDLNPDFLPASYLLGDIYERKQMHALSRKTLYRLSHKAENLRHPRLRVHLGDLALAERRTDEALDHWRAALERDHLFREARSKLIDAALDSGDVEGAKGYILEEISLDPYHTAGLQRLATLALTSGEWEEALEHLERALTINPEDDVTLREMGNVHHFMGEDDKALERFKRALDINPKSKELRRYVEFLFKSERPFEEPYQVEVLPLIATYPPQENPDNDSHEYLLLQDVIRVNVDGTSSRYHHRVVRILNDEGANLHNFFTTFYTPGEQKCRIQTARVIHPDGTIEEAKIDNREHPARAEFGERAPAYVDLPPLKPGDVVDAAFRTDDLKQSYFGDYFGCQHYFQPADLRGVRDSRLTLILPRDRSFRLNQRNLEVQPETVGGEGTTHEIRTWILNDLPKVDRERGMPDRVEITPCVEVSTYADWDAFGRWWWNLVEEQCDINDEMRAKVAELTDGLETQREKVRAIYNFVVSHIRYSDAWEFGVHGFKPYRASAIYSNRFGDCKDKAILMKSLLGEAEIESHPVLIRLSGSRSKEDLTLPLVSHFNHVITYVPEIDGEEGLFLDGTAQFHPMEALPNGDRGASVFVVKNGPGKIMTIPYGSPDRNLQKNEYDVEIRPDGSAAIELRHESLGTFEPSTRQTFLNEGKRHDLLERTFGRVFGELKIQEATFTDVEDLDTPVRYTVRMEVKEFLLKSGDRYQLRSVFFPSRIGSLVSEDERRFDMILGPLYTVQSVIRYRLPEGFAFAAPPGNATLENDFAAFRITYTIGNDGALTVERSFSFKAPRIASDDYMPFRDLCREAERAEERWIQVLKK